MFFLEEKVKVNGKVSLLEEAVSLSDFLKQNGYDNDRIAVEKNGEIVRRSDFEKTILSDEDILEIVNFVGGG